MRTRRCLSLWLRTVVVAGFLAWLPCAGAFSFFSPLSLFPDGPIALDLRLGSVSSGSLIDGNTSWDAVLENVGAEWNSHISLVQFTRYTTSPKAPAPNDGVNQVYWDETVNGMPFGAYTLAVATRWTRNDICVEADVVFDVNKPWNSYRGPLRSAGGGTLHDIYRVGLHELGHVLGLDHPDDHGQNVAAVMNSTASNVDHTTTDDSAGARALYGGPLPTIDQQPVSQTAVAGSPVQFFVQASGDPAPTYEWHRNNIAIPGATNATLDIAMVDESDAGSYRVRVRNIHGAVWSDSAILTVLTPPAIVTSPGSRTVKAGTPVTFSVRATGTKPLTYAWRHNGNAISNATSSSYTFTPRLASDAGEYSVTVMNSVGATTSPPAQLTVLFLPEVTTSASNITVLQGSDLVLSASVEGTTPLTYQWLFRGRRIPGATELQLLLTNVTPASAGTYVLEARNAAGKTRGPSIKVAVIVPPTIIVPPKAVIVRSNGRAVFRVTARGTKPLTYEWLKDGVSITNAIKRSYVIPRVQSSNAANYSVRITNAGGTAESVPVPLTVVE